MGSAVVRMTPRLIACRRVVSRSTAIVTGHELVSPREMNERPDAARTAASSVRTRAAHSGWRASSITARAVMTPIARWAPFRCVTALAISFEDMPASTNRARKSVVCAPPAPPAAAPSAGAPLSPSAAVASPSATSPRSSAFSAASDAADAAVESLARRSWLAPEARVARSSTSAFSTALPSRHVRHRPRAACSTMLTPSRANAFFSSYFVTAAKSLVASGVGDTVTSMPKPASKRMTRAMRRIASTRSTVRPSGHAATSRSVASFIRSAKAPKLGPCSTGSMALWCFFHTSPSMKRMPSL
mmetsp:Transcript_27039/g.93839  ORF Transcript_27039/g.93839 Transcript_27039/m.93839 type:complete len:301 (-) Transcript_27039:756-1658(-)